MLYNVQSCVRNFLNLSMCIIFANCAKKFSIFVQSDFLLNSMFSFCKYLLSSKFLNLGSFMKSYKHRSPHPLMYNKYLFDFFFFFFFFFFFLGFFFFFFFFELQGMFNQFHHFRLLPLSLYTLCLFFFLGLPNFQYTRASECPFKVLCFCHNLCYHQNTKLN